MVTPFHHQYLKQKRAVLLFAYDVITNLENPKNPWKTTRINRLDL